MHVVPGSPTTKGCLHSELSARVQELLCLARLVGYTWDTLKISSAATYCSGVMQCAVLAETPVLLLALLWLSCLGDCCGEGLACPCGSHGPVGGGS